jgi:hypothetical protein
MMRTSSRWIAIVLVAASAAMAASGAWAADSKKRYNVRGIGTSSCSGYLEARNINVAKSEDYAHWFTGFVTAYNLLQPNTFDIAPDADSKSVLRYLDIYCGKNPKRRVADAASAFVAANYARRVKNGPK